MYAKKNHSHLRTVFFGRKCYRMSPQEMLDVLKSKVEEGEIESSDLPKLPTIQGWVTRYSAQLREKNAQTTLRVRN